MMNPRETLFYQKKQEAASLIRQNQEAKRFEELFKKFLEEQKSRQSHLSKRDFLINFLEHFCVKNGVPFRELMDQLERSFLKRILSEMNGNQKVTSEVLGIKHSTLNEKIKRYGIQFKKNSL
jgi:DNA-binding NtrC family response regulator